MVFKFFNPEHCTIKHGQISLSIECEIQVIIWCEIVFMYAQFSLVYTKIIISSTKKMG